MIAKRAAVPKAPHPTRTRSAAGPPGWNAYHSRPRPPPERQPQDHRQRKGQRHSVDQRTSHAASGLGVDAAPLSSSDHAGPRNPALTRMKPPAAEPPLTPVLSCISAGRTKSLQTRPQGLRVAVSLTLRGRCHLSRIADRDRLFFRPLIVAFPFRSRVLIFLVIHGGSYQATDLAIVPQ